MCIKEDIIVQNSPNFIDFLINYSQKLLTMATYMKMKEWYINYVFWHENKQTWKVSLTSETLREQRKF